MFGFKKKEKSRLTRIGKFLGIERTKFKFLVKCTIRLNNQSSNRVEVTTTAYNKRQAIARVQKELTVKVDKAFKIKNK